MPNERASFLNASRKHPKCLLALPAPAQPESKSKTRQHSTGQFLSTCNWNEASLLTAHLYHADGNCAYSSSSPASLATSFAIANSSSACTRTVAVRYLCDRDDRFFVR